MVLECASCDMWSKSYVHRYQGMLLHCTFFFHHGFCPMKFFHGKVFNESVRNRRWIIKGSVMDLIIHLMDTCTIINTFVILIIVYVSVFSFISKYMCYILSTINRVDSYGKKRFRIKKLVTSFSFVLSHIHTQHR